MNDLTSNNMKKAYIFCNALTRPYNCLFKTNICCLKCDVRDDCLQQKHVKCRPCNQSDFDQDEMCEFLV